MDKTLIIKMISLSLLLRRFPVVHRKSSPIETLKEGATNHGFLNNIYCKECNDFYVSNALYCYECFRNYCCTRQIKCSKCDKAICTKIGRIVDTYDQYQALSSEEKNYVRNSICNHCNRK